MKTLLIMTVLFTQVSFAQTVIDPQGFLKQIDQFIPARGFHQEFQVGDMIQTEETECEIEVDENGQSSQYCSGFEGSKEVIEVGANYAVMDDGMAYVKELYDRYNRSAVRYFLREKAHLIAKMAGENLTENFEYHLTSLTPTSILGSEALRLEMAIIFSDDNGNQFGIPMFIVIAKDLPFMGQVAQAGLLLEINGQKLPPSYEVIGYTKY
ncbi:MAG: hypothetical protein CME65_08800 [Halobacteriovoraceae bacterium]|nr:hypothetical protein [Halobacteriovoraceae bacterium]|tara:strand:- start:640 stop:1269 length:630 start_codon:yes stop_codon:yes gene_type:complete